jgi:hypothetical protein
MMILLRERMSLNGAIAREFCWIRAISGGVRLGGPERWLKSSSMKELFQELVVISDSSPEESG